MKYNFRKNLIISVIGIFFLFSAASLAQNNAIVGASDELRIEQEDKLFVPAEKADAVWDFLYEKYVVDQESLKKFDPLLTSYQNDEQFIDTYFDSPDLKLLRKKSSTRYRQRQNLTNPDDDKSGRELIQIKIDDISGNSLERGEFKYEVERPNKINSGDDQHPLLGLLDASVRPDLKKQLAELGLDPYSMRAILTVNDLRKRIYLIKEQQSFISLSFDHATSQIWWAKADFYEIEAELNEIVFTEAAPEVRKQMEEILHKIVAEIKTEFPDIKSDINPKYNKIYESLGKQLPFLGILVRLNLTSNQGLWTSIFFIFIILGLVVYSLISKFKRK